MSAAMLERAHFVTSSNAKGITLPSADWTSDQGLSQDFKNACPKQQIPKFLPIQVYLLIYFKSLKQLYLNAYCVKNGNLHFSYVLQDGISGKYLVITPRKAKLKMLYRNLCPSKKEVFRKLPVQKTGRTGPG